MWEKEEPCQLASRRAGFWQRFSWALQELLYIHPFSLLQTLLWRRTPIKSSPFANFYFLPFSFRIWSRSSKRTLLFRPPAIRIRIATCFSACKPVPYWQNPPECNKGNPRWRERAFYASYIANIWLTGLPRDDDEDIFCSLCSLFRERQGYSLHACTTSPGYITAASSISENRAHGERNFLYVCCCHPHTTLFSLSRSPVMFYIPGAFSNAQYLPAVLQYHHQSLSTLLELLQCNTTENFLFSLTLSLYFPHLVLFSPLCVHAFWVQGL